MDFDIVFAVLFSGLAIINISPYGALIYVFVAVSAPLSNWYDFSILTITSLVFSLFYRITNPRR